MGRFFVGNEEARKGSSNLFGYELLLRALTVALLAEYRFPEG